MDNDNASSGGGGSDDDMNNDAPVLSKSLRPDWIDDENKIFINKLNFICKNFDKNHISVSTFFILKSKR